MWTGLFVAKDEGQRMAQGLQHDLSFLQQSQGQKHLTMDDRQPAAARAVCTVQQDGTD